MSEAPPSEPARPETTFSLFVGFERRYRGVQPAVVRWIRRHARELADRQPMVVDDATGEVVDLDLRPGADRNATAAPDAAAGPAAPRAVGRPKLGVVAREVTLLPRHWDWLNRQPGGASVALRRLVDEARRVNLDRDGARAAREAAYRFMSAIAGDLPGFEEAARALFAGRQNDFDEHTAGWPKDVRAQLAHLAEGAWTPT